MVKNALEPEWEAVFHGYSYGFRPGRTINDAVQRIRSILTPLNRIWVLEVDVSKCFDSISHEYLLNQLKDFPAKKAIKKWLKAGILFNGVWLQTLTGTPQGGIISPLLANIAMHNIGEEIGIKTNKDGRFRTDIPHSIVIYADDMVILSKTYDDCVEITKKLENSLAKRGLNLNNKKTVISNAYDGFDFLGFNFCIQPRFGRYKYRNWIKEGNSIKLIAPKSWMVAIAQPSEKSIKSVKQELKTLFTKHAFSSKTLVTKVNSLIRGWSNSKRLFYVWPHFKKLDWYLWNLQKRWIHRRHPTKGVHWRNDKYYSMEKKPEIGIRDKWTFMCPISKIPMLKFYWFFKKNQEIWVQIASDKVPDDQSLATKAYFKDRTRTLFDRKLIDLTTSMNRNLAKRQGFGCPLCGDSLFNGEELHRHHKIPRSQGGKDTIGNLCLVHRTCHHSIHYSNNKKLLENIARTSLDKIIAEELEDYVNRMNFDEINAKDDL